MSVMLMNKRDDDAWTDGPVTRVVLIMVQHVLLMSPLITCAVSSAVLSLISDLNAPDAANDAQD